MTPIKVIIVDDEVMARNLLKGILEENCPQIEVLTLCPDLPSAVKTIRSLQPDLIFLDIEMPGYSGLDLLDFFNESEVNFSIIFTTAYNQYAVNAFKLSAIDYLLKPLDSESIVEAVARFEKKRGEKYSLDVLRENLKPQSSKKLAIHTITSVNFIELKDIMYLKGDGSYTNIFMFDETKLVSSKNMKYFEEVLESTKQFIRCHKSYIVNIEAVSSYVKANGGSLILRNEQQIDVSPQRLEELIELISLSK